MSLGFLNMAVYIGGYNCILATPKKFVVKDGDKEIFSTTDRELTYIPSNGTMSLTFDIEYDLSKVEASNEEFIRRCGYTFDVVKPNGEALDASQLVLDR